MKSKVTEQGVTIPKEWFDGADEVEIRREDGVIVLVPLGAADPIWNLGRAPVADEIPDASTNLDKYLYGDP